MQKLPQTISVAKTSSKSLDFYFWPVFLKQIFVFQISFVKNKNNLINFQIFIHFLVSFNKKKKKKIKFSIFYWRKLKNV